MKRILLCFLTFALMIAMPFCIYATQENSDFIEEETILDDIQEEDLNFQDESFETQENKQNSNIILGIILLYFISMIKRIGMNKKILSLILGYVLAIFSEIVAIILLAKFSNITYDSINLFKNITIACSGFYLYIAQKIITSLEGLKDKTEDIIWKSFFVKGLKVLFGQIVDVIVIFVLVSCGLEMIYLEKLTVTNQSLFIACIGIIGSITASFFTILFYSILNNKKTIYKTKSINKVDGNRSLKL